MAPEWPEEVDVFRVPHSRMKELVHKYLDMVTSTNFSDVVHLRSLLKNLCNTFQEFRAHERIENKYIMRKLKGKLRSLSITNTAVCNCHSDNRLVEMLQLVKSGYIWTGKTARERLNYGLQLRKALDEFTEKFLPHMEEEEEVFQPMLIKYFTYEELREIKANVIEHHKARNQAETCEKCVGDAQTSESSDDEAEPCIPRATFHSLPDEIVLRVMACLSPSDLARSAQVCECWHRLAMDASLWTRLYPVSWSRGDMTFYPTMQCNSDEEASRMSPKTFLIDEDVDIDESESVDDEDDEDSDETDDEDKQYKKAYKQWRLLSGLTSGLLPRVGKSVTLVSLSGSTGVTNTLLHQILVSCTNLEHLDVSYTPISDAAFKCLSGQCLKLKHLDLSGCGNITDVSLKRLARAMNPEMDVDSECSKCCRADNIDQCGNCCQADDIECGLNTWDNHDTWETDDDVSVRTNGSVMLPYCELRKWLMSDNMLSDIAQQSPSSFNSNWSCAANDCCSKDNAAFVRVSEASVTHCNSSNIKRLIYQLRRHFMHERRDMCCDEVCARRRSCGIGRRDRDLEVAGLRHLSLSGCYQITDVGLRALSEAESIGSLNFLDLSGCMEITSAGLVSLVGVCPQLDHSQLFYCDNMARDPYAATASGCQNLECPSRFCCRFAE